ncbi:hypothetical protein ACM46_09575 [Chryseobacterium angstadtii]|uniref:Uncharacterized protein n=1 Tax=Chryseobacterium angstadtii TaxID=558151 RepID=A0A0J7IER9_9FLAO|nr:hypothetical protein [Chryseobacterium angstadtii]KMQ64504.1 hypothetical protein ACM46_09575 [Chryseobacterium angstadtii]
MNNLNFVAIGEKFIFLLMAVFYGIAGAQCIVYTGQAMNSGETYCLTGSLTLTNDITIPQDALLIIQPGAELIVKGITVNGNLEIGDAGSVKSEGSILIGVFGSQKNSKVKLGTKSYLSLTGSVAQGDPTFMGNFPGTTSTIDMGTNSVVEICGTFTQQSTTYPFVNYIGAPLGKAYYIVKAQASGGGASVISNDSQIIAIAMDSVTALGPGNASYCGPNATQATCSLWPAGLPSEKLTCGFADEIVHEIDGFCTKPAVSGDPDGYTKMGITIQQKADGWPGNIPNSFLALESKTKGFVITRVQHVSQTPQPGDAVAEPKEGMLVYDIRDRCVKLYNGAQWKCIERSCND